MHLASLVLLGAVSLVQVQAIAPANALGDLQIAAPSVAGTLLSDPTQQDVYMHLPPSYKNVSK